MPDKSYTDARIEALDQRIDDLVALTQRGQDKGEEALNHRLAAMDHERELIREDVKTRATRIEVERNTERLSKVESSQSRFSGALALIVVLVGLLPWLIKLLGG